MTHNPLTQQIEAFKQEGLNIVDKRGRNFETVEQRLLEFENDILLDNYWEYLINCEYLTKEQMWLLMCQFKQDMGIV